MTNNARNNLTKVYYFLSRIYGITIKTYGTMYSLEDKRALIKGMQEKYRLGTLIETGTYKGDALEYLKNSFPKLISIELVDERFKAAVERFKNDPHIKLVHGDSGEKLAEVLSAIKTPCMFWLDGHYSGGNTIRAKKDTPIYEEMCAIFNNGIKNNIILIDDARLFLGRYDYPWLHDLKREVDKLSKNSYKMSVEKDIIVLMPKEH